MALYCHSQRRVLEKNRDGSPPRGLTRSPAADRVANAQRGNLDILFLLRKQKTRGALKNKERHINDIWMRQSFFENLPAPILIRESAREKRRGERERERERERVQGQTQRLLRDIIP